MITEKNISNSLSMSALLLRLMDYTMTAETTRRIDMSNMANTFWSSPPPGVFGQVSLKCSSNGFQSHTMV